MQNQEVIINLAEIDISAIVTIALGVIAGLYKFFSKHKTISADEKVSKYEAKATNKTQEIPLLTGHKTLMETVSYLVSKSQETDKRLEELESERNALILRVVELEAQIALLQKSITKKDDEIQKLEAERKSLKQRVKDLEDELHQLVSEDVDE
jgi:chromosome segregation ATPase